MMPLGAASCISAQSHSPELAEGRSSEPCFSGVQPTTPTTPEHAYGRSKRRHRRSRTVPDSSLRRFLNGASCWGYALPNGVDANTGLTSSLPTYTEVRVLQIPMCTTGAKTPQCYLAGFVLVVSWADLR